MKLRKIFWPILVALGSLILLISLPLINHIKDLEIRVEKKFEGKRWAIPASVFARPLELYIGKKLTPEAFEQELLLAGYNKENSGKGQAGYLRQGQTFKVKTRDFHFADGFQQSVDLTVSFGHDAVNGLTDSYSSKPLSTVRIDPAKIGSFLPQNNQDRIILIYSDLPDLLVRTLLAVEDKNFNRHHGIDPYGIFRALIKNILAGRIVEGGSTLTQQLVKNFFLSSERTWKRKINESLMAIILEQKFSKNEILTAYANEIFLGQDGKRAVHGFGLASQFYFHRSLDTLQPSQIALLVALIKGPSYYNPKKWEQRCLQRRQVVLDIMQKSELIDDSTHEKALTEPLLVPGSMKAAFNRFPAFIDLIKRQLREHYQEKDLTSDGLKIFATVDPLIQLNSEKIFSETVTSLEHDQVVTKLEGAAIIVNRFSGEIVALIGGRESSRSGFNRALDARRQVGSLIKPAVYLTALNSGYTLKSRLEDTAIRITDGSETAWRPKNYTRKEHGSVMLYQALAHSYNLATVRLGIDLGMDKIVHTLQNLGIKTPLQPYPSLYLGSVELSPLEISTMYLTLATGGFFIPQRAITSVLSANDTLLQRSNLAIEQRFSADTVFLLNHTLQRVVTEGTAKSLSKILPRAYNIAGKTGTSNDLRDSWFAGFSDQYLGVVWIGRDDNVSCGLSGATGALPVWGEIMKAVPIEPLQLGQPTGIKWASITNKKRNPGQSSNKSTLRLPFTQHSLPKDTASRTKDNTNLAKDVEEFVQSIFDYFQ